MMNLMEFTVIHVHGVQLICINKRFIFATVSYHCTMSQVPADSVNRRSRSRTRSRHREDVPIANYLLQRIRQQVEHRVAIRALLRALRHLTLILLACRNVADNPPAELLTHSTSATWTQIRRPNHGWVTQPIFEMDLNNLRHQDDPAAQLLWLLDEFQLVITVLQPLELATFMAWKEAVTRNIIIAELQLNIVLSNNFIYSFISYILTLGTVLQTRYIEHRTWILTDGPFDALSDEMNYYLWMHRRFSILDR